MAPANDRMNLTHRQRLSNLRESLRADYAWREIASSGSNKVVYLWIELNTRKG